MVCENCGEVGKFETIREEAGVMVLECEVCGHKIEYNINQVA